MSTYSPRALDGLYFHKGQSEIWHVRISFGLQQTQSRHLPAIAFFKFFISFFRAILLVLIFIYELLE